MLPKPQVAVETPPVAEEPAVKPNPNPDPKPEPIPNPNPNPTPNPKPDPIPTEPVETNTDWQRILVNKQNPISLSFTPVSLASVDGTYELDSRVVPFIQEMIQAATADGIQLRLVSAYRDAELQQYLYQREIDSYKAQGLSQAAATEEAGRWVAIPGTSEHQTGLAADIVSYDWLVAGKGLVAEFATDPAAIWLKEHAKEHGFILRYPEDKTEITGIGFEPWHYRFVGVETATAIMDGKICLEEHLASNP
jgi:D-alanyl-D-alanine carboxypeptidase